MEKMVLTCSGGELIVVPGINKTYFRRGGIMGDTNAIEFAHRHSRETDEPLMGPVLRPRLNRPLVIGEAGEFDRDGQPWIISIKVGGVHPYRGCTLISPSGKCQEICPEPGTYQLIFPSGSASALRLVTIDPDPGK